MSRNARLSQADAGLPSRKIVDIQVNREATLIKTLAEIGNYMDAATLFLQLTKSMCKHFIVDEHYNYFDDLYAPEYTIHDLVDYFNRLISQGKLPEDVKIYLHKRWAEIQTYEACTDYGLLVVASYKSIKIYVKQK